MKQLRNKKILKLFEYFKTSFGLNLEHKELYKPQIMFLILRAAMILITGLSFLGMIQALAPFTNGQTSAVKFMGLMGSAFASGPALFLVLALLIGGLGSCYVEAGLYHMYAGLVQNREERAFFNGANRYFLPFLGGNLLIVLFWILASLPYVLASALTLTLGFILIPIAVNALLMVWKASVVIDNEGTMAAIKKSIAFGRANFIPASLFIIIKNAVSTASTSGGSSGGNFNGNFGGNDFSEFGEEFSSSPDLAIETLPSLTPDAIPDGAVESAFDIVDFLAGRTFSIIYGILLGTITLASVLGGMIQMIFEIFFALTTVVIYSDGWYVEPDPEPSEIQEEVAQ